MQQVLHCHDDKFVYLKLGKYLGVLENNQIYSKVHKSFIGIIGVPVSSRSTVVLR